MGFRRNSGHLPIQSLEERFKSCIAIDSAIETKLWTFGESDTSKGGKKLRNK